MEELLNEQVELIPKTKKQKTDVPKELSTPHTQKSAEMPMVKDGQDQSY